ncbi:MAG: hypothetical protein QNJ55_24280 [Xenococcus sp. MO_188.B8]|nr:hypothetical protein [Xenococcus sp. MO_188.B8]
MKDEANVDFWMYTGDRFLSYAEKYLELLEKPEVIEEAEEVRLEKTLEPKINLNDSLSKTDSIRKLAEQSNMIKGLQEQMKRSGINFNQFEESIKPKINLDYSLLSTDSIRKITEQFNIIKDLQEQMKRSGINFNQFEESIKPKIDLDNDNILDDD